jgi:GNAT superfamily N-acetyltransferase
MPGIPDAEKVTGGAASAAVPGGRGGSPRGGPAWLPPASPLPAGITIRPYLGLREEAIGIVRLFHAAFPPEQRIEDAVLLRLIPQVSDEVGGWRLTVAVAGEEEILGFALAHHVSTIHLGYLAYLAVTESQRGLGLGAALWSSVLAEWGRLGASAPHWLFLEVERPEVAESAADRALRERRIGWYERFGCQRIHADFQAPPLGPGLPIVPYWVLVRPLRDPDLSPLSVRNALTDIYREIYGLAENHPLVQNCQKSFRLAGPPAAARSAGG